LKTATTALLLLSLAVPQGAERPHLDMALQAARWLESTTIRTPRGNTWPADPREAKTVRLNLYSGMPGVVLFFLEAYHATGNRSFLDRARSGADYLVASLAEEKGTGLYEGIAGIGFTLTEAYKTTADKKFEQAARRCVDWIRTRAVKKGRGIEWSEVTDIISGSAGTGLFLLYAARELKNPQALELAVQAGHRLVELGLPENGGLKWAMSPTYPSLMPNFSHGTAGIAYFLATLYQETKEQAFLQAALAGGKYLQSIAATEGGTCLIFHDEPGGKQLYYLGWCHGPPGTGRLFYRLHQVTGDAQWLDWFKRSARSLIESGIPEKETPGFWNNVSQCCGSAGVAEYSLEVYRLTRESQYLDFARKLTADLQSHATRDETGARWIQAESRLRPELLVAQTGLMQGSAGIGMWLLRLDHFEQGTKPRITLPDSPF
jgi:lantibiotic modifying enzyme